VSDLIERSRLHCNRWLWLNQPYDDTTEDGLLRLNLSGIQLGEIHVGDGRQYVYWETQDAAGQWAIPPYLRLTYKNVRSACEVLKIAGAPGVTYRLSRFDRTPLLTARAGLRKWVVKKWRA
jgi:hypothetical protein